MDTEEQKQNQETQEIGSDDDYSIEDSDEQPAFLGNSQHKPFLLALGDEDVDQIIDLADLQGEEPSESSEEMQEEIPDESIKQFYSHTGLNMCCNSYNFRRCLFCCLQPF